MQCKYCRKIGESKLSSLSFGSLCSCDEFARTHSTNGVDIRNVWRGQTWLPRQPCAHALTTNKIAFLSVSPAYLRTSWWFLARWRKSAEKQAITTDTEHGFVKPATLTLSAQQAHIRPVRAKIHTRRKRECSESRVSVFPFPKVLFCDYLSYLPLLSIVSFFADLTKPRENPC